MSKQSDPQLLNKWLHTQFGRLDTFIGTGAACNFYAENAKLLVEHEKTDADEALVYYDHMTRGMYRWNRRYRPSVEDLVGTGT